MIQTEAVPVAKRHWAWLALPGAIVCLVLGFLAGRNQPPAILPAPQPAASVAHTQAASSSALTNIYAHNLRLHQGPNFRVYVQWLRGQLRAVHKGTVPSFDDPESFYLNVTDGIIRANLGDICNYLNSEAANAPLRDIKMTGAGAQVKITGTMHKVLSFPVELSGVLKPASNNRVEIRVDKIELLKVPLKRLLGGLHLTVSSFMPSTKIPGLEVSGNSIFFDCERLAPPPHIRGNLTAVSIKNPDVEAVYGNARQDAQSVEQWRNFLRLEHGQLTFGKLTMNDVDLMMVDISQDAWFDLDLAQYQQQLVGGYTRITRDAGLQIFMPEFSQLKASSKDLNIQWFKNRNAAPPNEVVPKN